MKKVLILIYFSSNIYFCTGQKTKTEIPLTKVNYSVHDLFGIWSNSNIESLRNGDISLEEYFKPCSGFVFSYDNPKKSYSFFIQYGEQKGIYRFNKVKIQRGNICDTLYGYNKNIYTKIAIIEKKALQILSFYLIDYKAYGINPNRRNEFVKISSCKTQGNLENYIIDKVFNILPLKVLYLGKEYVIANNGKDCSDFLTISGFDDYHNLEFITYHFDKLTKEKQFKLALFKKEKPDADFYLLIINKNTSSLIKTNK
jgi:hypothetical protein